MRPVSVLRRSWTKAATSLAVKHLIEARKQPPRQRCLSLVAVAADAPLAHGGEAILDAGRPVGEVMSAAFGATLDRVVMLGYVETGGEPVNDAWIASRQLEVDVAGVAVPVQAKCSRAVGPGQRKTEMTRSRRGALWGPSPATDNRS